MIVLDRCHDLAVHHDPNTGVVVLEYASQGRVLRPELPTPTGTSRCSRSPIARSVAGVTTSTLSRSSTLLGGLRAREMPWPPASNPKRDPAEHLQLVQRRRASARPPAGAARPLPLRDLGARLRSSPTVATACTTSNGAVDLAQTPASPWRSRRQRRPSIALGARPNRARVGFPGVRSLGWECDRGIDRERRAAVVEAQ